MRLASAMTCDPFMMAKLLGYCWLQVGTVWINCWMVRELHMPFGGKKSSGTGREGVKESIEFFTEVKTTCCQLSAP